MCSRWNKMDFTCSKVWLSDVFFVDFGQKGALWQEEDIMGLMHTWYSIIGFIYNWFGSFHVICWLQRKICPFKYSQRWMNMWQSQRLASVWPISRLHLFQTTTTWAKVLLEWVVTDRFSQLRENSDPTSPEKGCRVQVLGNYTTSVFPTTTVLRCSLKSK